MGVASDMFTCIKGLRTRVLLPLVFALTGLVTVSVQAMPIDKTLNIYVYDVCSDTGTNCASLGPVADQYFQNEVNKVWAQAGISVSFLFSGNINSTLYSNIDDNSANHRFYDLALNNGHHTAAGYVDMFMVHTVAGAYGEGWLNWGGLVMAMDTVMAYNGGLGRIDTVAHELGHNLNLPHYDTASNNLMASGGVRSVPTTIADIAPDGLGYDSLTASQIATARSSWLLQDLVLPEPGTVFLLIPVLVLLQRRRRTV